MPRFTIASLALFAGIAVSWSQPAQPADDAVAKLIAQLGSADFRVREQAGNDLVKLGDPLLPALRKATIGNISLEAKRRIEAVVERIENVLLAEEEKGWKDLDEPRRSIKERLRKVLARTPTMNDEKLAVAIYLLAATRMPTEKELAQAQQQLKARHHRLIPTLQLARTLVQGKEYNGDLAAANAQMLKAQKDLPEGNLTEKLGRVNGPEFMKLIQITATALDKAAPSDTQFGNLAFLLVLSRFPDEKTAAQVALHLNARGKDRRVGAENIVWALINTKEFLMESP